MSSLKRRMIITILLIVLLLSGTVSYFRIPITFSDVLLVITSIGLVVALYDITQPKHSLRRNFPFTARLRDVFEDERPKLRQYFGEDDLNGKPYNREHRSDIYQKAKQERNTTPFGTQLDVYEEGYEFLKHSQYPIDPSTVEEPRFIIGSKFCTQPYDASIFNISAMSFGALSDAAILALNGGAKLGRFYHNTGEGGISPYHLIPGGDLCFQIGTGYFGAGMTVEGRRYFDPEAFKVNALKPNVKMIEIKMSQGAKPGHGGILPAKKNTKEIAGIRGVTMGIEIVSPPFHSKFSTPDQLIDFITELRALSGGKPIGIKLCIGDVGEFRELAHKMAVRDIYPDFITIDGGEGGTGAAPIAFTNYVGTPLVDALITVNHTLSSVGIREHIKIIAAGKASNSFDVIKLLSLGADGVNAARAFMISLGCIQARECDKDTCPVGVATQDKTLSKGLDPNLKKVRVYNYHHHVIHEVRELMAAAGMRTTAHISPKQIAKRVNGKIIDYSDLIKDRIIF